MWVSMQEMQSLARPGRDAIGAFHALNLEQAQGILEAAVETRSPVIVAIDQPAAMYAGLGAFLSMLRELAADVPVPVSAILDHVDGVDFITHALELGCPGVLVDSRDEPDEKLFARLKRIKELCLSYGAFFEGEIKEPEIADARVMDLAGRMISGLGPDSVCITAPRDQRAKPSEDLFKVIGKIAEFTDVPLGLAGAGAWPVDDVARAAILGVWKFSVGTRINVAFTEGLKKSMAENPGRVHPRSYLGAAREALRKEVIACIRSFGTWENE